MGKRGLMAVRTPATRPGAVPARFVGLAAAISSLMALSACSQVTDQLSGAVVGDDGSVPTRTTILETVAWAELDGMVSVLVENPTDRVLRRADAMITVRNERDVVLASSASESMRGPCCTAVDVPPGGTVGFYFYAGEAVAEADRVEISYRNSAWAAEGSPEGPGVDVTPVGLRRNDRGTIAVAEVDTADQAVDTSFVQAMVNGPDGEFLTVISGYWYCLRPGAPQQVQMQLFQRVPAGSSIDAVSVVPMTEAATLGAADPPASCDEDG